jgi:hypothetical protein
VHFGFNDDPRPLHQQRPGLVNDVNLLSTTKPDSHTYAYQAVRTYQLDLLGDFAASA